MTQKISLFLFHVALVVCIHFSPESASAQSDKSADPFSGRIILIEPKEPKGNLKIRQGKRAIPANATEGMLIRRGDMLTLSPTARAMIICSGGDKPRELVPGVQGSPCRKPCTREGCGLLYDGSPINALRGPDTDTAPFPVIISPRKTMLRNLRPTIRWTPIAGATKNTVYNVTLFGEGMKPVWARDVTFETSLPYPAEAPPLMPGQTYKVVVTSEGRSSRQDNSPGLGFITLTAEQARALADEESRKKELGLPEMQTRFLVSNVYAAGNLYSEAIEQLDELYKTMKEPAIAAILGDLYTTIGLNREAEKKYLEALRLTDETDLDGRGLILRKLSQVYELLGITNEAITRLEEAITAYRLLGNTVTVRALQTEARQMKRRRGTNGGAK